MDDLDTDILETLLRNAPHYVSGSSLAKTLGMSRVSVWKRMEKLQKQGLSFNAIRNRGYCMNGVPECIHPNLLEAQLRIQGNQYPVHFYEETDSTNLEAQRKLADGCDAPALFIAKQQSAGRGRLGRQWAARDTGNLYMTFAFRPNQTLERMQLFTLWVAAVLCEFLNSLHSEIGIKWPNDIVFRGKKLAGILTEAQIETDCMSSLVLGLGLNVNSNLDLWPDDVRRRATCMAGAVGDALDINALAASVITHIFRAYDSFIKDDFKDTFKALWQKFDALFGKEVTVIQNAKTSWSGIANGVDEIGSLVLTLPDGVTRKFQAGEVTLAKK